MSDDFIFRGPVAELDPDLAHLLAREEQRQATTIILIASESEAPEAVGEALTSAFGNIYAEGYPREESRQQTEAEILDLDMELAHYRRYSDPRYYKGVEYADTLEALARRRAAELFAANGISPNSLFVNVQPLSGAPANSAVYTALIQPGDTILGLNLNDGGHLTHGAPVNRSGKVYKGVPYFVDEQTEALDYDAIEALALEHRPRIIVAGYSAYPRIIDWRRFREIADKVGAYLLADIAHISGLVAAVSHLPAVVAAALMRGATDERQWTVSASGFRDAARLAGSDPRMMLDILLTNREAVLAALRDYQTDLAGFAAALEREDAAALAEWLAAAQVAHAAYRRYKSGEHLM